MDRFGLPSFPAMLARFTTRPQPRSRMPGTKTRMVFTVPSTLMSRTRRHSCAVVSSSGLFAPTMPAELTSTSTGPICAGHLAQRRLVGHVGGDVGRAADVQRGHGEALGAQPRGARRAEPARAAGHQGGTGHDSDLTRLVRLRPGRACPRPASRSEPQSSCRSSRKPTTVTTSPHGWYVVPATCSQRDREARHDLGPHRQQVYPAVRHVGGRGPGAGAEPVHHPGHPAVAPQHVARVEVAVQQHGGQVRGGAPADLDGPLPDPRVPRPAGRPVVLLPVGGEAGDRLARRQRRAVDTRQQRRPAAPASGPGPRATSRPGRAAGSSAGRAPRPGSRPGRRPAAPGWARRPLRPAGVPVPRGRRGRVRPDRAARSGAAPPGRAGHRAAAR